MHDLYDRDRAGFDSLAEKTTSVRVRVSRFLDDGGLGEVHGDGEGVARASGDVVWTFRWPVVGDLSECSPCASLCLICVRPSQC